MKPKSKMKRDFAVTAQRAALESVRQLSILLVEAKAACSPESYDNLKRGIGLSIGAIQIGVLDVISSAHPDLDHLEGR